MTISSVPDIRIRCFNSSPIRQEGKFVLYWMVSSRRTTWNFALDRAVEWAKKLHKPLVILEALRCDYRWASDRMHSFMLDGMAENACRLEGTGVLHYPFVELKLDEGKGLLSALAAHACVVVTDDFPCFFLPHMVDAAAQQVSIRVEVVDSNGLLPLGASDQAFTSAHSFRSFLQKNLPAHLMVFPKSDAISGAGLQALKEIPREISARWPSASRKLLNSDRSFLAKIAIDHQVVPVDQRGGTTKASGVLKDFVRAKLGNYLEERNEPEEAATSGLSPYLHFGHLSAHQIFSEVAAHEDWSLPNLAVRATGSRMGWWGMSEAAEGFVDQVVTWRELGFNFCHHRKDWDKFDSLPEWALKTLRHHARDERPRVYALEEFERAATHDPLWNASQVQLVQDGWIHNYMRMLWGKKILEWTESPTQALEIMVALNNKYAVDGRDPNSYSGIFWCLGRYDRPWGPKRPIFGTVRYMSSQNTARKYDVKDYLRKYANHSGPRQAQELLFSQSHPIGSVTRAAI